jgi:hypothetical protein
VIGCKAVGSSGMIERAVIQWSGICNKMEDKKFKLFHRKEGRYLGNLWCWGTGGSRERAGERRCRYCKCKGHCLVLSDNGITGDNEMMLYYF